MTKPKAVRTAAKAAADGPKTVRIDGKDYPVPVMKFKALKQSFPILQKVQEAEDPMEMVSAGIQVLSIAMIKEHPDMTPEWLEENMNISETVGIGTFIKDVMVEAGLVSKEDGEALLAGEGPGAAPSTETSTPSSQS